MDTVIVYSTTCARTSREKHAHFLSICLKWNDRPAGWPEYTQRNSDVSCTWSQLGWKVTFYEGKPANTENQVYWFTMGNTKENLFLMSLHRYFHESYLVCWFVGENPFWKKKKKRWFSLCDRDSNGSGNQDHAFTFIHTNLGNVSNWEGH